VIGILGGDIVGALDLTAHGVDGHQRAFGSPRRSGMAVISLVFAPFIRDAGIVSTSPR
jgi:hypothetical protein